MAAPYRYRWIEAVASPQGPPSPHTRHVLHALSMFMTNAGRCYPAAATLAMKTGLSERSVRTHLATAHQLGWIERRLARGGRRGRSGGYYVYQAREPETLSGYQTETASACNRQHIPAANAEQAEIDARTGGNSFRGTTQEPPREVADNG